MESPQVTDAPTEDHQATEPHATSSLGASLLPASVNTENPVSLLEFTAARLRKGLKSVRRGSSTSSGGASTCLGVKGGLSPIPSWHQPTREGSVDNGGIVGCYSDSDGGEASASPRKDANTTAEVAPQSSANNGNNERTEQPADSTGAQQSQGTTATTAVPPPIDVSNTTSTTTTVKPSEANQVNSSLTAAAASALPNTPTGATLANDLAAALTAVEETLALMKRMASRHASSKQLKGLPHSGQQSGDSESHEDDEEPVPVEGHSNITITSAPDSPTEKSVAKGVSGVKKRRGTSGGSRQSRRSPRTKTLRSPRNVTSKSPKTSPRHNKLAGTDSPIDVLSEGSSNSQEEEEEEEWASPFNEEEVGDSDVAAWLVETYADEHKRENTGFDVKLTRSSSVVGAHFSRRDSLSNKEGPSTPNNGSNLAATASGKGFNNASPTHSPRPLAGSTNRLNVTIEDPAASDGGGSNSGVKRTTYERTQRRSYPAFCSTRRYRDALDKLSVERIPDINDPDFDIFKLLDERGEAHVFYDVCLNVLCQYNFIRSLQLDVKRLSNFIRTLKSCYRSENPYHNSIHAADVLQTTHTYMCVGDVKENFSDVELLAILFAAMVHDLGHLGVSNTFLTKARHPLAMMYNDISPLESMHLTFAFQILSNPSCNFFLGSHTWSKSHHADFRQLVIETVLGTDMRHHHDLTAMVRDILDDGKIEDNEVSQLFKGIVHAADMSNPMKPIHIYKQWIHRVIAEFWQQGDEERRRGVPISMMCDRTTAKVAKGQCGFIDFVVKPYMTELESVLPPIWFERLAANRANMEAHTETEDLELRAGIERLAASPWVDVPPDHPCSIFLWLTMSIEPHGKRKCGLIGPWLRPDDCSTLIANLTNSVDVALSEIEKVIASTANAAQQQPSDSPLSSSQELQQQHIAVHERVSHRWVQNVITIARGDSGHDRLSSSGGLKKASAAGKVIEEFLLFIAISAGIQLDEFEDGEVAAAPCCLPSPTSGDVELHNFDSNTVIPPVSVVIGDNDQAPAVAVATHTTVPNKVSSSGSLHNSDAGGMTVNVNTSTNPSTTTSPPPEKARRYLEDMTPTECAKVIKLIADRGHTLIDAYIACCATAEEMAAADVPAGFTTGSAMSTPDAAATTKSRRQSRRERLLSIASANNNSQGPPPDEGSIREELPPPLAPFAATGADTPDQPGIESNAATVGPGAHPQEQPAIPSSLLQSRENSNLNSANPTPQTVSILASTSAPTTTRELPPVEIKRVQSEGKITPGDSCTSYPHSASGGGHHPAARGSSSWAAASSNNTNSATLVTNSDAEQSGRQVHSPSVSFFGNVSLSKLEHTMHVNAKGEEYQRGQSVVGANGVVELRDGAHCRESAQRGTLDVLVAMTRCWLQVLNHSLFFTATSSVAEAASRERQKLDKQKESAPPPQQRAAEPSQPLSSAASSWVAGSTSTNSNTTTGGAGNTSGRGRHHLQPLPEKAHGGKRKNSASTPPSAAVGDPSVELAPGALRQPPLLQTLLAPSATAQSQTHTPTSPSLSTACGGSSSTHDTPKQPAVSLPAAVNGITPSPSTHPVGSGRSHQLSEDDVTFTAEDGRHLAPVVRRSSVSHSQDSHGGSSQGGSGPGITSTGSRSGVHNTTPAPGNNRSQQLAPNPFHLHPLSTSGSGGTTTNSSASFANSTNHISSSLVTVADASQNRCGSALSEVSSLQANGSLHAISTHVSAAYAGRTRRLEETSLMPPLWERKLLLDSAMASANNNGSRASSPKTNTRISNTKSAAAHRD